MPDGDGHLASTVYNELMLARFMPRKLLDNEREHVRLVAEAGGLTVISPPAVTSLRHALRGSLSSRPWNKKRQHLDYF